MSSSDYSGSCSDTDSSDYDYSFVNDTSSDNLDLDINRPINSLIDKNGTMWELEPPLPKRTPAENIMYNRFGVAPWIQQNFNNAADSFKVFFRDEMYGIILKYTNQRGRHIFGNDWIELEKIILDGFIGCLLSMGVHRDNQEPITELFGPDEGRKIYRDLFSLNRFKQIMRSLLFYDMETRDNRKETDKFCHIRELWNVWVNLLIRTFRPLEDGCIDEQLVAFRSCYKFKRYMPSKPAKYGIKFFRWSILSQLMCQIYVCILEKEPTMPHELLSVGKKIVMELMEPFYGSGRNLVCDKFFTSVELADELLQKKITMVGTMRSNKREIPFYLRPQKNSLINSSLFVFHGKKMIVRYLPRKNKPVYMLCSSTTNVHTQTEPPHKPDVIVYYNTFKGVVDTIAKLLASVPAKRTTRRWPLVVFFNMLDISLVNSFCIYKDIFSSRSLNSRNFLKLMAEELATPLISGKHENVAPMNSLNLSRDLTINQSYARCRICTTKKDKKTTMKCNVCFSPCCRNHSKCICTSCSKD